MWTTAWSGHLDTKSLFRISVSWHSPTQGVKMSSFLSEWMKWKRRVSLQRRTVHVCEDRGRMYLSLIFLNLNVPHFSSSLRYPDERKMWELDETREVSEQKKFVTGAMFHSWSPRPIFLRTESPSNASLWFIVIWSSYIGSLYKCVCHAVWGYN